MDAGIERAIVLTGKVTSPYREIAAGRDRQRVDRHLGVADVVDLSGYEIDAPDAGSCTLSHDVERTGAGQDELAVRRHRDAIDRSCRQAELANNLSLLDVPNAERCAESDCVFAVGRHDQAGNAIGRLVPGTADEPRQFLLI